MNVHRLTWILAAWTALVVAACSGDDSTNASSGASSSEATSTSGSVGSSSSGSVGGSGGPGGRGGFGGIGGIGGVIGTGGGVGGVGGSGVGGLGGFASGGGGIGGDGGGQGGAGCAGGAGGGGAQGGGSSSSSNGGAGGGGAAVRVRIVTANTTTGNDQSYDPGQGIRIFEGLHPDIALVQEFNYGDDSAASIRSMVDTAFGPCFDYQRETTVGIPNGIVSRYPILGRGTFVDPDVTNRSFVWARIDVPGPRDLWAVSVHLLTTSPTNRDTEAHALLADLQALVPAGDLLVIGGDFNTKARDEACILTLAAIVDNQAPYPVDNLGNDNTNGPRSHAYDWLMPNAGLHALQTPVVIGAATFVNGLVLDSQVYVPLADVAPVMAADSNPAAPNNMQHMAVAKDFLLGP